LTTKRLTFGLTLGRGIAPPCLVVVATDRGDEEAHAARLRVWPAGTRDGRVARHVQRLASARRPTLVARPSDAKRLRRVPGLGPLLVSVWEPGAVLAARLHDLMRSRRLRIRAEGLDADQLQQELFVFPRRTGPLVLALAMAAWVASD
jgi:hypothetical protein